MRKFFMCKSGLSENKVQNSMHRMLLVFLIQRNTCMCMKFFWKGEQEGEGWEAAQRQRIYGRVVRSSLNRGV